MRIVLSLQKISKFRHFIYLYTMKKMLSIDLGVKTGLVLFNENGEIIWYRSRNFGNKSRLNRAINSMMKDIDNLEHIVIEGGGDLLRAWQKEASRLSLKIIVIQAETWRRELLPAKVQKNTALAKAAALKTAAHIIKETTGSNPKSLTDDAAEALLSGYWALKEIGWRYDKNFFPHAEKQGFTTKETM